MIRFAAFCVTLLFCACASSRMLEPKEAASGKNAGIPVAMTRVFNDEYNFREFTKALFLQYPESDFPKALEGVLFGKETLLVIFGGPADADQKIKILRAALVEGRLVVGWCKEREKAEKEIISNGLPSIPVNEDLPPRTTPFLIAKIPFFDGEVRFIQNRALLDGP